MILINQITICLNKAANQSIDDYLIPINFRLPLIFGRGWPKIRGDQKVQVFGWPKIKGDEVNSKPFENASLAHESYFHYMEIQK